MRHLAPGALFSLAVGYVLAQFLVLFYNNWYFAGWFWLKTALLTPVVALGFGVLLLTGYKRLAAWLGANIRVNAIAPGFFLTEQNRYLLTEAETGMLTARGQRIMDHTPMGRFGSPEDLNGAMLWLLSPASAFVTGIVVPIDGGFSAYSGV